jgi:3',5'-cyclic AMP phosphodiesterase CpdA
VVAVSFAPEFASSFQFLYLGDPQCGLEAWGRMLGAARRRHPRAAFLLIAGDLVDRGNERTNWDHFFLRAAGVFDQVPVMPAVGNHEYLDQGPRLYRAIFELPRNGPQGIDSDLVYAFEYGNVFVAVLDSTLAVADASKAETQAEWLDAELRRTRAEWKLVMFHHPLYASHPTRESLALRAAWEPVLDAHQVDLVLQGHDHAYLRTYPLRRGRRVGAGERGTTYVVSVSGTKYYDQRERPETAVGFTGLSTYQTIDIEAVPENRLIYRAWDAEGREVDSLTIARPCDAAGSGLTFGTR